jgi:hypothetical protein
VPTHEDIQALHDEIDRIRSIRPDLKLESHHTLPQERILRDYFRDAGLDIEQFKTHVTRENHRYKPTGLHTGTGNYNALWRRFLANHPKPDSNQIFEYLKELLDKTPW